MTIEKKAKSSKSVKFNIPEPATLKPRITIFGVGGAGGNAINNMIRSNLEGVEFVAANTDSQALINSLAENRIQLGIEITKGLGAGSFPDRGKAAAEENIEEIEKYIDGNNMIFIAAGMGGGTGTGAAPVIGAIAKEKGILTVGVVTKPFHFEGKYRMETAENGIEELKRCVDTLIVIPNQNLFRIANENTTFESAFKMADDVLQAGVRGVTDLITMPGLVNLDFADIRTIMTKMGKAMMGTGEASGENRAVIACEEAVSNPLLDDISIKGAKGVLVNMTGGPDMTLFEADMAVNAIKKEVDENANIIFGSAFDENMKGKIRISVVATGIDADGFIHNTERQSEPSRFRIDSDDSDEIEHSAKSSGFFDPGTPVDIKEDAEKVSDVNFKTKKNFLGQEISDTGVTEEKPKKTTKSKSKNSEEEENNSPNFFSEERKSEPKKISSTNRLKAKPKTVEKEEKKKESSGFGLFGFMNNIKPKEEFEEEEEKTFEDKIINDNDSPVDELPKNEEKTDDIVEEKRQKFFGNKTVFDDLEDANEDSKIDDDILNVPAFFRRKKK